MLKRFLSILLAAAMLLSFSSASGADSVVLTCWVYYNGVQEQQFSAMVQEFNDTVGMEQGVIVDYVSKSSISELDAQVRASALKEPGAEPMPDLFAAYADTTFAMHALGVVADISPYLPQAAADEYIGAYLDEGRIGGSDQLNIFPVAKSTELLLMNQTAWRQFQEATGADESKLTTWEGIAELAGEYFTWTDGLTPDATGDGSAFFGRDSMANYLLIGAKQLGSEIFTVTEEGVSVTLDKAAARRLWDCFYVPFASGWFTAEGRFRSDDIKTGRLIALVGSTSGAMYFPKEVTFDDGATQAIECQVLPLPNFRDAEPYAVQQGAGFVVAKSTHEKERAAITFLRWFTEPERNIEFSAGSGYLPVTKAANQPETVSAVLDSLGVSPMVRKIIETGAAITTGYHMYTNKPFAYGYEAREVLESTLLNAAKAANERRLALMAGGAAYPQAVSMVCTDEAFESWYQDTYQKLVSIVGQE